MRKIFMTLVALVMTLAANAQVFVGGEVGFWRNYEDNHTSFTVAPQVGYNITNKWAIGLEFDYDYNYYDGLKVNGVGAAPFARYTAAKAGPVSFLLDAGFAINTYKAKYDGNESDSYNAWQIGVTPGVKVSLTKSVDFIAALGFLGYRDNDDPDFKGVGGHPYGEKGFGFHFNTNDLKFGVIYNF